MGLIMETYSTAKCKVAVFNNKKYYLKPKSNYYCIYRPGQTASLHRDVWEFHNGKIPNGFHVHHIDGNSHNNDISNLEILSTNDHSKVHNFKNKLKCKNCNRMFDGTARNKVKGCSPVCRSKIRRCLGLDDSQKSCPVCSKLFMSHKFKPQITCSKKCGAINRHSKKEN